MRNALGLSLLAAASVAASTVALTARYWRLSRGSEASGSFLTLDRLYGSNTLAVAVLVASILILIGAIAAAVRAHSSVYVRGRVLVLGVALSFALLLFPPFVLEARQGRVGQPTASSGPPSYWYDGHHWLRYDPPAGFGIADTFGVGGKPGGHFQTFYVPHVSPVLLLTELTLLASVTFALSLRRRA